MEAHNGGGGCERECDPQPRRRRAKFFWKTGNVGAELRRFAKKLLNLQRQTKV